MKRDKILLIMAAGMGSRFGGLKQVEPIGPNSEILIEYSVYDAIKAGFTKVVFVIKKENKLLFREIIGDKISRYITVEYVFQELNDLPKGYKVPDDRIKPWGTGQAVLCAKDKIKEPFAIINADDFYGRDAILKASLFLDEQKESEYAVIGYKIKNTLSINGAVKRGVCVVVDDKLTKLIESSVEIKDSKIIATPLDNSSSFEIESTDIVSMNLFCFHPNVFKYLENEFKKFLENNISNITSEFLIPDIIEKLNKENKIIVPIIKTDSIWYGITYKEDKDNVVKSIEKLIKNGEYPNHLWEEQIK